MDKFIHGFANVEWWLSVAVTSVLLNLASAYLKIGLDKLGSRLFSVWRNRSERSRVANEEFVSELRNSNHLQWVYFTEESKLRFAALTHYIFGLFLLAFAPLCALLGIANLFAIVATLIGALDFVMGMKAHAKATVIRNSRVLANEGLIKVDKRPSTWKV